MKKAIYAIIVLTGLGLLMAACDKDKSNNDNLLLGTWNAVREYSTTLNGTPINDESVEPGVLQWIFDETTLTFNADGISQKRPYSFDGTTITSPMSLPVEVLSLSATEMTVRMQMPVDVNGEIQIGYQYVVFKKQ